MISAPEIQFFPQEPPPGAVFSILIPSWNNLPLLKICIDSLHKNSAFIHQIIIHVNEGTDGTLEWVKEKGYSYSYSRENCGVCHALNAAASLADSVWICFFNDDMYALPGWDSALREEVDAAGTDQYFFSTTMIEPKETGNACVVVKDFGTDADSFREKDLLNEFAALKKEDWSGATWPPNLVRKALWNQVGGYSPEFSPGIASDPDFSMKLWQAGVRYFKGVGRSRVYHFLARSTGRVQKNDGARQFLDKWGITPRVFAEYFLRRGKKWEGPLQEPGYGLCFGRITSALKKLKG